MKKEVIEVQGMSCAHCENRVNTAVSALDGVKDAKASAKKSSLTVKFDESAVTIDKIKETVKEAGYEVK